MSRFDDELRSATGRLADEPLPAGILDDGLANSAEPRRVSTAAGVLGVAAVVVMAAGIGWGIGRQTDQAPDPSTSTVPSAAPSTESVRHEVEVGGIRLAVELDSDHASEGVPVLATATVENLRSDPTYYPVSGRCEWATDIRVERRPAFEVGRAWDGAAADLTRILLREWGVSDFTPYYFVGDERLPNLGTGCFMDAGRNEIPAGASRVDELAWRPLGPFGMPLPSGSYELTATFAQIRSDDEVHNRDTSDDVTLRFDIEIEGSPVDYLMPGEAVDIVLADDRMQAFLADVRQERWRVTALDYRDGVWVATIPVGQPSAWDVPDYTVVAEVDARSGALLTLNLNDGKVVQCGVSHPMPSDPVHLYFPCGAPLELHAVLRGVTTQGEDRIAEVVDLFLAGPDTREEDAGFGSLLSPGDIEVVEIAGGRLVLNFPAEVNNVSTSAGSRGVLDGLRQTLLVLDGVTEVELRLRGDCAKFFEWIQVGPTCHVLTSDGLVATEP